MRDAVDEIRARGAELFVIGNGGRKKARAFYDERGLDFPLLIDTGRSSYRAAGLRRGVGVTFAPASLRHAVRAFKGGFRQQGVQGDPWQQGGAFVITPAGEVLFSYISGEAGDHADPRDLVAALPA